jgi:NAD(P)-dependent dehydrogenase (short-subunit alcohol dehydrogenase family)
VILDAFRLDGKVALVTGAARGIGGAIALGLAEAGADIAIVDLPAMSADASTVAAAVAASGRLARFYPFDVTQIDGIAPLVDRVAGDFGRLDILVNNAGTNVRKAALDVTPADWDAVLTLNLKSYFFFAQAAARRMIASGGGRIVMNSSSHATIATGNNAPYVASKGGVSSLTRELAFEWIRHGVAVNAFAAGPVTTPRMEEHDRASGRSVEDIRRDMERRVPLGRRLRTDELVSTVLLLASPAGSALVGEVIVIDGGQTIF